MNTKIPPTIFSQIIQTKSSPETIAALLNEAEERYSDTPKHSNAKRVYPYWKMCQGCLKVFPIEKQKDTRLTFCSRSCSARRPRPATRKPLLERSGQMICCAVCGKEVWKPAAWLKKIAKPTCSKKCNGQLRGAELKLHSHKGRAAWSAEAKESYRKKMTGENNPAWKGGVTYFRKHGNYKPIKYVRCPLEFIEMARKDGYVMEHRLIVARALGRCLKRTEVVHHIDHDPTNNELSNLQLFASNRDHKLYEHHGSPAPIWQP